MHCEDHLGNKYASKRAMCKHYNISYSIYVRRVNNGWSLKDALTTPMSGHTGEGLLSAKYTMSKTGCYLDHLGNPYCTVTNMCECWGLDRDVVKDRMLFGMSLKEALTYSNNVTKPAIDKDLICVFGELFPDYNAIDDAYGFVYETSVRHKDNIEEWLQSKDIYYVDGVMYRTKASMCIAYHIPIMTYEHRRQRGWDVTTALKTPLKLGRRGKPHQDHLGVWYDSLTAMCAHYGLDTNQYCTRKRYGWSLEKILTTPVRYALQRPLDTRSASRVEKSAKVLCSGGSRI